MKTDLVILLATPNHISEDKSSDTDMLMLEKISSRPFIALISADVFVHPSWRSGRKGKIVFYLYVMCVKSMVFLSARMKKKAGKKITSKWMGMANPKVGAGN